MSGEDEEISRPVSGERGRVVPLRVVLSPVTPVDVIFNSILDSAMIAKLCCHSCSATFLSQGFQQTRTRLQNPRKPDDHAWNNPRIAPIHDLIISKKNQLGFHAFRFSCVEETKLEQGEKMLQKAASNAYSWWWASHIRTKQSKWLEQNLLDMEEKVHDALKLIEEDGDSFAKRAEMYYKKRPELINFVEESYRGYRALAERYDKISTELQNANNTIASVFPEQVQFAMDEEDEEASLRFSKRQAEASKSSIPKVPKAPITDLKSVISLATKKLKPKKASSSSMAVLKLGLSKPEALDKIDGLQKRILTLQTEKEFMRSMYENGVAKYWEIEKQIKETQESIFSLQDEVGENLAIEDDEARSLMATAALKSCEETLAELQEKQDQSTQQAKQESEKITDVKQKLASLRHGNVKIKLEDEGLSPEIEAAMEERKELEILGTKNKSLSVAEMAEKIDELVLQVMGLGTSVSSQTALVQRLRTETEELQAQIRSLEDDKATLINGKLFSTNKNEMEKSKSGFAEESKSLQESAPMADTKNPDEIEDEIPQQNSEEQKKEEEEEEEEEEEPDWQQMFINGLEGREKILLQEYTTTLRNYKDVKKKLGDEAQRSHESSVEASKQLRELKNSNAVKDEEIKSLRQKLVLMQKCFFENKDMQSSAEKDNLGKMLTHQTEPISEIEQKFRVDIDELLEENLDFWLKFSTSLHEIQKFETGIQDLQNEVTKLEEKKKKTEGGSTAKYSLKSDARPIYKYLREIQTELTVWLEKSETLKDELQSRFSSLCNIQEEITAALKVSAEADDFKFTSYQAAKFQGEVLNMKQENNRVAEELKAGIEFVTTMQIDVESTLSKMNEEFKLAASKRQENPQLKSSESRNRVPLRSFIFGSRTRRQKGSIFSYVVPAMHRKYHGLKTASPL